MSKAQAAAFFAISCERERQDELKAEGRFDHTCADPELSDFERLAILVEEIGEVSRALQGDGDLEEELIQTAAVALAWLEGIYEPRSSD